MLLIENVLTKPILEEMSKTKLPDGVLCRISYPICDIGQKNANDRVYEDAVWDKVEAEDDLKDKLENRALFGHAEHPEQTQSNLEKTSHVIFEMWRADGQEWQKFDVLDTPTGRIVDCLHRAGCRVGCSTRAEGDLEEAEDDDGNPYQRVVAETYKYVTTDFTADPSTFGSIPYDIKRDIVTEVKKLFENKKADDNEKAFGAGVLEGMKCGDSSKCQKCGCCSVLKEKKLSAKAAGKLPKSAIHKCHGCGKKFDDVADVNTSNLCKKCAKLFGESRTVESSIKDGIIKAGADVKYGGDDAKVEKIEENAVSLAVGTVNPTVVSVHGEASLAVSPEGLITILPTEVRDAITTPPEVEPEVPLEAEPEEVLQDEPEIEPTITEPGNTGFGLPAVEDEIPEAAKRKGTSAYEVGATVQFDQIAEGKCGVLLTGADIGQKERKPKYFDTEQEAKEYATRMNKQLSRGEKEHYKLRYKTVEGKVTKVEESGITIALDDGTVVDIEDPSSVNITVTAPAPALEVEPVEPVVDLPKEEEVEAEPELDKLSPKEEFESKVDEQKLSVTDVKKLFKSIDGCFAKHLTGLYGTKRQVALKGKAVGLKLSSEGEAVLKGKSEALQEGLAAGNLLQDKDGVDWIVKEAGDRALVVTQPGEPGTEKRIGWDEIDSHGFTKVSEVKVEEGLQTWVTRCTECGWKEANSDLQKCSKCGASTKQDWKFESKVEEAKSVEKADGWHVESPSGADLGGPYGSKVEADKRKKDVEFYAASKESISTTAKEISDLKVKEAATRSERDKAIELIEELTNEKDQLGEAARKEKAFETKALVGKINTTLEAKEREVDALRAILEEKVKLVAEVKKQLEETKTNSSNDLKSLNESISVIEQKHQIEADALMEHLQKTDETHTAQMNQFGEQHEAEKAKHQKELDKLVEVHKEKIEEIKKEVGNEVKEKITKEFIKGFVKNRLSETALVIDENSRALLEKCKSIEEVDEFLDDILEASRRGALHSESIASIHVSQQEIVDPETKKVKHMVGEVFEGMNNR